MIRPRLEYAAPVWTPNLCQDIDKLKAVQKFITKMCSKNWKANYPDLYWSSTNPPVSMHRGSIWLSLTHLFKIMQGFLMLLLQSVQTHITQVHRNQTISFSHITRVGPMFCTALSFPRPYPNGTYYYYLLHHVPPGLVINSLLIYYLLGTYYIN